MTEAEIGASDQLSLFVLGTAVLRHRWRIMRWVLVGGAIAAAVVAPRRTTYLASASFISHNDQNNSDRLASLAGQFGVAVPTGNPTLSPTFYAYLLTSRVLLQGIVRDTFVVPELGGKRVAFLDLFELKDAAINRREEKGVALLAKLITTSVSKTTGIVGFSMATEWPSVSAAITKSLVSGVNEFNKGTRQGQAAAERKFVEGRLALARTELRDAEDRLAAFVKTNKQFGSATELTFERERLQRDLNFKQQVFTSLTQSVEEALLREVRDTPVITVVEQPEVAAVPRPRGRAMGLLIGLILGGVFGTVLAIAAELIAVRRLMGGADAKRFFTTLDEVKDGALRRVRRGRAAG